MGGKDSLNSKYHYGTFANMREVYLRTHNEALYKKLKCFGLRYLRSKRKIGETVGDTVAENSPYIIPKAFDPRVGKAVSKAVAKAAVESGVARK